MKRLIVNADDFGLTSGVNRAISELHLAGKLTSATLMATARAAAEAAKLASTLPRLGIGCHLMLVDGHPVLPADQLPTLAERSTGRFRVSLLVFVRDLLLGRIRSAEIEAEIEAQIVRLRWLGVCPTHLDTHKHTHIFPQVLAPVLAAAKRQGILAIRNPFEPEWSVAASSGAPSIRRAQVRILNRFEPAFRRNVDKAGLATTDGALGVLATGTLDSAQLSSLLRRMPNGTFELVTHPGYNDVDLTQAGTRLLASREAELEALGSAPFSREVELIHFGRLSRKAESSTAS